MAGLYNCYVDTNGAVFNAFVIITTNASQQMSYIHSRMPVILDSAGAARWIENRKLSIEEMNTTLRPYKSSLELYKVS